MQDHFAKSCFPGAIQVTDRFHVTKIIALEARSGYPDQHRWDAMTLENEKIIKQGQGHQEQFHFRPKKIRFTGDTRKQLLARSRIFTVQGIPNLTLGREPIRKEEAGYLFESNIPIIRIVFWDCAKGSVNIFIRQRP